MQAKVFKLWEEYQSGERSARKLLKACAHLVGAKNNTSLALLKFAVYYILSTLQTIMS